MFNRKPSPANLGDPPWRPRFEDHRAEILSFDGVNGVGIGGRPGREHVVVYASGPARDLQRRCATILDGIEVRIVKAGPFRYG
jgi:hypothetical protein